MAINSNSTIINQFVPDFRISAIQNGDILVYDNTRKSFINMPTSSALQNINGSGIVDNTVTKDKLSATGGNPGDVLTLNPTSDLVWSPISPTGAPISISNLTDVSAVISPVNGEILSYNGTEWVAIPNVNVPVTSVAGKIGIVTLLKADIVDFVEGDYATAAQGATADTAVQPGANISTLTNDLGFLTSAPVTSVAGKIGVVTLVKADITDFVEGDYATAAQGATADTAVQPGANLSIFNDDIGITPAPVDSVHGRIGAVVAVAGDYTSVDITNQSAVAGATVDAALTQLDTDFNSINLTVKTDKIIPATVGNLAALDATGNLTDSGSIATDFATAAQGALAATSVQLTDGITVMSDVDTTTFIPSNGQALIWNNVDGEWQPGNVSTVTQLNHLTDVDNTLPLNNSALIFNGTEWTPSLLNNTNVSLSVADISDVIITGIGTNDNLSFDGTNWVNKVPDYNDLANVPATYTPAAHTHVAADVTDFVTTVDSRNSAFTLADLSDTTTVVLGNSFLRWNTLGTYVEYVMLSATDVSGLANVATSGDYADLINTPTAFVPASHVHPIADVTGLQTVLTTLDTDKADKIIPATVGNLAALDATGNLTDSGSVVADFATAVHTHVPSDIVGLVLNSSSDVSVVIPSVNDVLKYNGTTWANATIDYAELTNIPALYAPSAHTHVAADVTDFDTSVDARNSAFTLLALSDTASVVVPGGFLRWNALGTEVTYTATISAATDITGLANVATSSDYADLINTPAIPVNSSFNLAALSDTALAPIADTFLKWDATGTQVEYVTIAATDITGLANVATTGDYADLANAPAIPGNASFNITGLNDTSGTSLADGFLRWNATGTNVLYTAITAADITGLATVAATGDYADLANAPTTIDWSNVTSIPLTFTPDSHVHPISEITNLQAELDLKLDILNAFSGDYNDLVNTPILPVNNNFSFLGLNDTNATSISSGYLKWNAAGTIINYATSIPVADVTGLSTIATTGDYADLVNTPTTFPPVAHMHVTADIAGINAYALDATISVVGKTGDYSDLINAPVIPTNTDFTLTGLSDTNAVAVPSGYAQWDVAGTTMEYVTSIPATDVTGLVTVATTGALNDINEVNATPTTVGQILSWDGTEWVATTGINNIVNLTDVNNTPVANGYLRWNTIGDNVIFEENIDAGNITNLAVVATTNNIFDLTNVSGSSTTITIGQVLTWDGTKFIPQTVTGGGGGGGSSSLIGLTDTLLQAGTLGQALTVISVDGTGIPNAWQNANIDYANIVNTPTSSAYALTGLSDTNAIAVADGFLKWNSVGSHVEYVAINATDIVGLATVATTGNYSDILNRVENVGDLNDVSNNLAANGDVLIWNSTAAEWQPGAQSGGGGGSTLNGLTDVNVTTAVATESLVYNGSIWVNTALTTANISGLSTVATTGDHNDLINIPAHTMIGLNDTNTTAVANGFLQWNALGTQVDYVTISSTDIAGLSTVATTGDYADLINSPIIPANNSFSIVGLSDTAAAGVANTFLVWNAAGTQVEYQEYPTLRTEWNLINSSTTLTANNSYHIDTAASALTVTLPAAPTVNDHIRLVDYSGNFSTNNLTINTNGSLVNGSNVNIVLNTDLVGQEYTFLGGTRGWVVTTDANVGAASSSYPPVWTTVTVATTMANEGAYMVDTTGGVVTVSLPLSPIANDIVKVADYAGTFSSNPATVARNGQLINGAAADIVLSSDFTATTFTYIDATVGWRPTQALTSGLNGADWNIVNTDTTITSGDAVFVDTSAAEVEITLPANPSDNDVVRIVDLFGTAPSNRILVLGNTQNIMGGANDLEITNINASIEMIFVNSSFGWKITDGLGELLAAGSSVNSAVNVYVDLAGSDVTGTGSNVLPFATVHRAIEWSEQLLIGTNGSITINLNPGIYANTTELSIQHANGDKISIVGSQTTSDVTITALGSAAPTAIQITVSSVAGIGIGDYVRITNTAGTGNHEIVQGVFKVASIGASSFTVNPNYSQTLPTFSLTGGTVRKYDTVMLFNGVDGITVDHHSLGNINDMVLAGNNTASTNGITVGGNVTIGDNVAIHEFGSAGIVAKAGGEVTGDGIVISQCSEGIVSSESSVIRLSGSSVLSHCSGIACTSASNGTAEISTTIITANNQGITAGGNGYVNALSATITASVGSAITVNYGGSVDANTATVDNTNDAGTLGSMVSAFGFGSIKIGDQNTGNIGTGVTFSPAYGTMNVPVNGAAYIGNV